MYKVYLGALTLRELVFVFLKGLLQNDCLACLMLLCSLQQAGEYCIALLLCVRCFESAS